ncbi:hypothetical protein KVT40_006555 [Elsinoe batatas]|uniref:Uncharacterized protein n=1 Tax=Elsinoe batatas TaxID=2601811 RepID=A0A8K0L0G3_9PEZI|nr:hypothetical protein KVT40_006555 [Elsinoe batatas]
MMGFFSRVWWLCRKLCLYGCLASTAFTIFIIACGYFLALKPYEDGLEYEGYVRNQIKEYTSDFTSKSPPNLGYDKHVTDPLIRDADQLWAPTYNTPLGLHNGHFLGAVRGYGKREGKQSWVFVGGTNPDMGFWSLPVAVARANGSCVDPPAMCEGYTAGYQRLVDQQRANKTAQLSKTKFFFADCDVSPAICDYWAANPSMMVHVETMKPCQFMTDHYEGERPRLVYLCSVKWTYIALPIEKMPFNRKVWIADKLVPAFPSEYEQLRAMVWYDGVVQALEEFNSTTTDYYDASEAIPLPEPEIDLGVEGKYDSLQSVGQDLAKGYMRLRGKITGQRVNETGKYDSDRPFM